MYCKNQNKAHFFAFWTPEFREISISGREIDLNSGSLPPVSGGLATLFMAVGYISLSKFTVKAQEFLIPTWMRKMVAAMEAAIFNCQCDRMQNCEDRCEIIYIMRKSSDSITFYAIE